jgi:hypothetical protein
MTDRAAKASAQVEYTPPGRLSFPSLFQPGKKPDGTSSGKYELTLIFPKGTDLTKLKALLRNAVEAKWGKNSAEWPSGLQTPIRPNSDKAQMIDGKMVYLDGYEEGGFFVRLSSKQRPGIVDKSNERIGEDRADEIYAGCWVQCTCNAFVYGGKGTAYKPGVSLGLRNVQKIREGAPLGGRMPPEKEFKPLVDPEETNSAGSKSANDLL